MADIDHSEEIKKIISEEFGISEDDIEDDADLDEDLGISDLEVEDLIEIIHNKLGATIPQEEYQKFKKVSDIASYIYENPESVS